MAKGAYFRPEFFAFLSELKAHNDRDWFQANKARYEEFVRDPFLRLIADLAPGFREIDSRVVVDPSPNRGSMFRIYRDTRFSADKTPYKTHVAAHFRMAGASAGTVPGYYLHFEPGESMIGGGVWHPEPRAVQKIRAGIVERSKEWGKVRSGFALIGETLKRPPAGYRAEHPLIEDLKRKDFAAVLPVSEEEVLGARLEKVLIGRFKKIAPFVSFLDAALRGRV